MTAEQENAAELLALQMQLDLATKAWAQARRRRDTDEDYTRRVLDLSRVIQSLLAEEIAKHSRLP